MPPNTSYNPYEILGIQKGCSDKALKDAYKLQCLKWHPDKNPNNKEEAERKFIAAKEAFQFLFDKEKRDEYDKGIDRQLAKEAKQAERLRKADTERKRFINELERREKEFSERGKNYKPSKTAEESNAKYEEKERKDEESRVRAEFEQLRKQLEKEVAEEMRAQQERMAHPVQHKHTQEEHDDCPKLRLKWTPGAAGEDYDETQLRLIFHEYGAISEVTTIFTNKKGVRMCIVEFEKGADCWGAETESGAGGPEIQAVWVTKPRETAAPTEPRPDDSSADTKPSGPDFATMSFEELQAQILGDMGPPIEKKKKWEDEQ